MATGTLPSVKLGPGSWLRLAAARARVGAGKLARVLGRRSPASLRNATKIPLTAAALVCFSAAAFAHTLHIIVGLAVTGACLMFFEHLIADEQ